MNIGDGFRMSAALDQESLKTRCAQANDIAELVCDLLEKWKRLQSTGGPQYERAGRYLDMARAEWRRRKREEKRAA